MTSAKDKKLRAEKLCYLTTYNAEGKPGTVEIWFLHHEGKVYIDTAVGTLKVRKLRADPRASVAIGSRKGPVLSGTARFADEATVRRVAPLLNAKYDGAWGDDEEFIARHLGEPTDVLLEVRADLTP
jgi:PPOX class probable F420-dependent enzyme